MAPSRPPLPARAERTRAAAGCARAGDAAHPALALQRAIGNRNARALLAREPRYRKRWGDKPGETTYLELSPTAGRLHLPDQVLVSWPDKENTVRGVPLESAVLNSLKLVNPTLRVSALNQRLTGRGVLEWATGHPFSDPTQLDVDVAVWRKRGTLRFDATASAYGLEGEVNIRVNLPRHEDGDLEAIFTDFQRALVAALPSLDAGPLKGEALELLAKVLAGELDVSGLGKELVRRLKRLARSVDVKAIEKAVWTALSRVLPKLEARIRVRSPLGTITAGSASAEVTPGGPHADLTLYGAILAPPGKVTSAPAPVLGVYGERIRLDERHSFQAGLLQKLSPEALSRPGATLPEKLPTALYGEYTYKRRTERGYELGVTFSLKLSTDELAASPAQPQLGAGMFDDRVRGSLKPGGGADEYGLPPRPGDIPTLAGITIFGTHGLLDSR